MGTAGFRRKGNTTTTIIATTNTNNDTRLGNRGLVRSMLGLMLLVGDSSIN